MKKKNIFEAIALFVIGIIGGGLMNCFLEKEPLWKAGMNGIFLGIILSVVYLLMVIVWGYLYDEHYPSKLLIIWVNIISVTMLWYSMITFTTDKGISSEYAWMHIVYLGMAVTIVFHANREGKKIRKANEKCS